MVERRKFQRIQTSCPILYATLDSTGQLEDQGIGVMLDISKDGMMFESTEPIEATTLFVQISSNEGVTMKIEGLLVYSMPCSDGKYRTGLQFKQASEQVSSFVAAVLKR